ncbi:hypothetical protein RKE29_02910 [Streptomyces sp. B1866]|uniref:hypothetical protein n=1 Tax=Streptomyces sp. B1866 TaxID=3075431 RepID=UPI002891D8C7|nr:hypothetical protein [Streptomyces sp. B1866]MDT3395610.1 hypothetical protein [Streptomyces sp. B1866]
MNVALLVWLHSYWSRLRAWWRLIGQWSRLVLLVSPRRRRVHGWFEAVLAEGGDQDPPLPAPDEGKLLAAMFGEGERP